MKTERLLQLDGLRGISSLFIVLFHYWTVLCNTDVSKIPKAYHLKNLFINSQYGVEVFFTLSGFVVAYSYKSQISELSLPEYMKPRLRKLIVPLILVDVWLTVQSLLYCYHTHTKIMVSMGWVENVFPISSVTWFVDVLLLNYLLYYLVTKFVKTDAIYFVVNIVFIIIGYSILVISPNLPFMYNVNGRSYTSFFIGVLICELYKKGILKKYKILIKSADVIILLMFILSAIWDINSVWGDFDKAFRFIIAPVVICTPLVCKKISNLLKIKFFQRLGKLSMAIYFSHHGYLVLLKYVNIMFYMEWNFSSLKTCVIILLFVLPVAMLFNFILKRVNHGIMALQKV